MMPFLDQIEDTRQPKCPPTHAPCDRCRAICDVDDMTVITGAGRYGADLWLCEDCAEKYEPEVE